MNGLPSVTWVGKDIAEQLKLNKSLSISYFKNFEDQPSSDIVFIIKILPSIKWLLKQIHLNKKLVYFPVDNFSTLQEIKRNRYILSVMDAIVVHNDILKKELSDYVSHIYSVEHYLKYKLNTKKTFIKNSYILWIGHTEYLPSLVITLHNINLNHPIKVLTDLQNFKKNKNSIIEKIKSNIPEFHITYKNEKIVINNIEFEQWSEKLQEKYMKECKCAFDTKEDSFRYQIKPPTKSQQYIFNNIPLAVSSDSYSYHWFLMRGLKLPSINDSQRWFSEEYFLEIENFVKSQKKTVSIDYIATQYLNIVNNLDTQNKANKLTNYNLLTKHIYIMSLHLFTRVLIKIKNLYPFFS